VGLNPSHEVVFDFKYVSPPIGCKAAWNAVPVPFDDMHFD
jgi:hypothetical protein